MAIAASAPRIRTTIISSTSVKPFLVRIFLPFKKFDYVPLKVLTKISAQDKGHFSMNVRKKNLKTNLILIFVQKGKLREVFIGAVIIFVNYLTNKNLIILMSRIVCIQSSLLCYSCPKKLLYMTHIIEHR
jgi:hypothetical protein